MTKPTCAVHVVFHIKPEHAGAFRAIVVKQAENSLTKESWCHQFDVATDPEKPHSFFLYETYDDRAAFEKHRGTQHFAEFTAAIEGMVDAKEFGLWDIA